MKATNFKRIMLYITAVILFASAIGVGGVAFAWLYASKSGDTQTVKSGDITVTHTVTINSNYNYLPGNNLVSASAAGLRCRIEVRSKRDYSLRYKVEYSSGKDNTRYRVSDTSKYGMLMHVVGPNRPVSGITYRFTYRNPAQAAEDAAGKYIADNRKDGYFYYNSLVNADIIPGNTSDPDNYVNIGNIPNLFESVNLSNNITLETGEIIIYITVEVMQAYPKLDWNDHSVLSVTRTFKFGQGAKKA